jgi:IS1 family transposase
MEEMWSFYQDQGHQIWLWRAIDRESGEVIAFWFGTREHKNLDKLMELVEPLKIGEVYTDGNYAYYERFSPEVMVVTKKDTQKHRKETSVVKDIVRTVSEERHSVFENGTDAQDCCGPDNKCLVFGESLLDPIILEHYPFRARHPSSLKFTSSIQCRPFSIPQCPSQTLPPAYPYC